MTTSSIINKENLKISELFQLAWDGTEGLQKVLTSPPMTSIADKDAKDITLVVAPYRFRVSEESDKILILPNDPKYVSGKTKAIVFHIYDIRNKSSAKITLPATSERFELQEIPDFSFSGNNRLYLLEHLYTNDRKLTNRLRLLDSAGNLLKEIEWGTCDGSTLKKSSLSGKCIGIVKVKENELLVQAEDSRKTIIFKIDIETGDSNRMATINNANLKIFADDDFNLHYIHFNKEANARVYTKYYPVNDKEETRIAGREIYAALGFSIAMDANNNIYCAEGFLFSCITPELNLKWILPVNNIVLESGHLLLSEYKNNTNDLVIYKWAKNGLLSETLKISLDIPDLKLARLIGLTKTGDLIIEAYQGGEKLLLAYNKLSGKLKTISGEVEVENFRLQSAKYWQVDGTGSIYLPVASDEALHFIKISNT